MVKVRVTYNSGESVFKKCECVKFAHRTVILYIWSPIQARLVPVTEDLDNVQNVEIWE